MLDLPDVTLVMIETQEHELGKLAVQDCVRKVNFGDVLIFSDKADPWKDIKINGPARLIEVPNWPAKIGWSTFSWQGVSPYLRTTHTLYIQWDAWIWDETMWTDNYLRYDYVGAPWWYDDGKNVGNGGFSIRSTRLCRYLRERRDLFPVTTHLDDDLLCRKYRPSLEASEGFEWAPEYVAKDFAFEAMRQSKDSRHFGFHAAFNFGEVLNPDEMLIRTKLVMNSPYIRKTGHIWQSFSQRNKDMIDTINAMSNKGA